MGGAEKVERKLHSCRRRLHGLARRYWKPLLFVFAILLVASLSLLRANFNYADDMDRAVMGYGMHGTYGRYVSSLMMMLLTTNTSLFDISPLPQIIALLEISLAILIVVYGLNKGKLNYPLIIATLLIGLNPYMLNALQFKFDAPCIALSILVSVIPIFWWRKSKVKKDQTNLSPQQMRRGVAIATICTFVMLTSYQAASGILPMVAVALAVVDWWRDRVKAVIVAQKAIIIVTGYLIGSLLFLLIMPRSAYVHVNQEAYYTATVMPIGQILTGGFIFNLVTMWHYFASWLLTNPYWLVILFSPLMIIWACISCRSRTADKLKGVAVGVMLVLALTILAFGNYIILSWGVLGGGRYMVSTCFAMGLSFSLSVCLAKKFYFKLAFVAIAGYLSWSFAMYWLAYGNALADQKRYYETMANMVVNNMETIYNDRDYDQAKSTMTVFGIGKRSPVMRHLYDKYPITAAIFMDNAMHDNNDADWRNRYFSDNFDLHIKLANSPHHGWTCDTTIRDNRVITIAKDSKRRGRYCVALK